MWWLKLLCDYLLNLFLYQPATEATNKAVIIITNCKLGFSNKKWLTSEKASPKVASERKISVVGEKYKDYYEYILKKSGTN